MNDRIQKLAEQAGMYVDLTGKPWPKCMSAEEAVAAYEKFAQLIVQECVKRLRFEGELGKIQAIAGPSGTYKIAFMNQAANILKEHFGVEE